MGRAALTSIWAPVASVVPGISIYKSASSSPIGAWPKAADKQEGPHRQPSSPLLLFPLVIITFKVEEHNTAVPLGPCKRGTTVFWGPKKPIFRVGMDCWTSNSCF
jgi:hypothetical protein